MSHWNPHNNQPHWNQPHHDHHDQQQAEWDREAEQHAREQEQRQDEIERNMEARRRPLPDGDYWIANRNTPPFEPSPPSQWLFLAALHERNQERGVAAAREKYTIWRLTFEQSSESYVLSHTQRGLENHVLDASSLPRGLTTRPFSNHPGSTHQRFRILYKSYINEYRIHPLQQTSTVLSVGDLESIHPQVLRVNATPLPAATGARRDQTWIIGRFDSDRLPSGLAQTRMGASVSFSLPISAPSDGKTLDVDEPQYSNEYLAMIAEGTQHCSKLQDTSVLDHTT